MEVEGKKNKKTKKKVKRGRKKKKELTIFYNNINGIRSKYTSTINIVKKIQPEILALCETKLGNCGKLKKSFPDYELVNRITKQGKGGLLIAIKKHFFFNCMDVTSSPNKDIMVVRLGLSDTSAIRLILGYGPQENEPAEDRAAFITELSVEVQRCIDHGDSPILIGDLNGKLDVAEGEILPKSPNGRLIHDFVSNYGLSIINFTEKCTGKWTRVTRTTGEKSVLDYVITNSLIAESIVEMVIDEECLMCPFHVKKEKGKEVVKFTDHNSILLKLAIEPPERRKEEPQLRWRINDEGRAALQEITQENNYHPPALEQNPQDNYNILEKEINTLAGRCFSKVKVKAKKSVQSVEKKYMHILGCVNKFAKRGKTQRRVAQKYKTMILNLNQTEERVQRSKNLSNAIQSMTLNGNFSSNSFWKAKRCVYQKPQEICSTVLNTNGIEMFGESAIKEAYREEFSQRLDHRKIAPNLTSYELRTNETARVYVEIASKNKTQEVKMDELKKVLGQLKNGAPGPDLIPPEFFANTGDGFLSFLLQVINHMKSHVHIPVQWLDTLIKTIYKNKGSTKVLKNHRGIFLTQVLSKIYERILKNRANDVLEKVSKLQAGSRNDRGTVDNHFLLKGCIDHSKYLNNPVYITVYDFEQCFDALWLEESIISLWRLGLRDDSLAAIFKLNEQAKIRVKTPAGTTEEIIKPTIVKQGTVSGPAMCSASTAEFIETNKEVRGVTIGSLSINTMVLVDDVCNVNTDIWDVIQSHSNIKTFGKLKRQPLSGPKCFVLPVNVREKWKIPILTVGDHVMEIRELILYLGLVYNSKGTNKDMLDHRIQNARTCMINSIAMCSDVTLGRYLFQSFLLIYKSVFLMTLLYGCQSWTNLIGEDMKRLKVTQMQFLKRILHVPSSTCNSIIFHELGVLPIEYVIHAFKLVFLHHIVSLEIDDPVYQMYVEQGKYEMEINWANEVKVLRLKYELPQSDTDIKGMDKEKWKMIVKEKITEKASRALTEKLKTFSKGKDFSSVKEITTQKYFFKLDAESARTMFKLRSRTFDIKAWRKFKYPDLRCRLCNTEEETFEHVVHGCKMMEDFGYRQPVNVYEDNMEMMKAVIERVGQFKSQVEACVEGDVGKELGCND